MRVLLLACCLVTSLFGGQSLRLTGDLAQVNSSMDLIASTSDIRVEGQFYGITPPVTNRSFIVLNGVGFRVDYIYPTGLYFTFPRDGGSIECIVPFTRSNFVFRLQRLYNNGSPIHQCEAWDVDGGNYTVKTDYTTSLQSWTTTGAAIFGPGDARVGFLRVFTSAVPLGSKPPATADNAGAWAAWKLDGDGSDASGNGRTLNTGAYAYEASPAPNVVVVAKTENTPFWAPFRPLRAGHPSKLDGSGSYSMSDVSSSVTCLWQQLEGPSNAIFDNRNNCTPTLTGLVFGPYKFRLRVKDQENREVISDTEIGAVAYDDNGVVIYPDARLNALLGPSMVLGASPWEWVDERQVRLASYNWDMYEINGGTMFDEQLKTVVNGIPRTGTIYTDIPAQNTTAIHGVGTNFLAVFCGGRPGPSVWPSVGAYLNIRAAGGGTYWYPRLVASCQSDTELTLRADYFIDSALLNPGIAAPGVAWSTFGFASYRQNGTGTIYTSAANHTKLYGVGTNFLDIFCNGAPGVATGTPGIYVIENNLVTRWNAASCQSNTELTLYSGQSWATADIASPGVAWGYDDAKINAGEWRQSNNVSVTSNYYDVALANYALYYRSGWKTARESARWMAKQWWKDGFFQALRSQSIAGSIIAYAIDTQDDPESPVFWSQMETRMAGMYSAAVSYYCRDRISDVREAAFCLETNALMAMTHPDPAKRATAVARVQGAYDQAYSLKAEPEGYYVSEDTSTESDSGSVFPLYTVSQGSATVTKISGADITSDFCGDPASYYSTGTLTLTTGNKTGVGSAGADFTGQAGKRIFIRGTYAGQPYSQVNEVAAGSGTSLTLVYPWAGTTGAAVAYRIQSKVSGAYMDANIIGTVTTDAAGVDVKKNKGNREWYWCTVNSATQLTLDRPYELDTSGGNVYRQLTHGNTGDGITTYMILVQMRAFTEAALALDQVGDTTRAAGYRTLRDNAFAWIRSVAAVYPQAQLPYLADWAVCYPASSQPNYCDRNEGTSIMRDYMTEGNYGVAEWYADNPTVGNKTVADDWYAAQFSEPGFASIGGDAWRVFLIQEGEFQYNPAKFYGQPYGVGGAQAWPAARLGGPAAAANRPYQLKLQLPAGAADALITKYLPTGATATQVCTTFPCALTGVDVRAGGPAITWEYRTAGGASLGRSDLMPLRK